jgi:Protein of unknown function (DUF3224)
MGTQATGTFTVAGWDESTFAELGGGGKLTRAHVTFGFDGDDLKAEGGWEAVMCYRADGTAVYTGYQQMAGTLAGREGTFVLRADGQFRDGAATSDWEVIDGSATGGLAGLRGSGSAISTGGSGGTFTFDYELA